jgi:uncharacterized membrane protein
MIWSYDAIGREPKAWQPTDWAWGIGALLMWLGSILFVGSFFGNPALPGARGPRGGPKGVFGITRHPMMWGFAFWAISHILVIAQPKSVVFYSAILILALVGSAMQDRKKAGLMGDSWHEWTAQTAFFPFTRGLGNPGAVALVGGTLLYLVATWLHPVPVGVWRYL